MEKSKKKLFSHGSMCDYQSDGNAIAARREVCSLQNIILLLNGDSSFHGLFHPWLPGVRKSVPGS